MLRSASTTIVLVTALLIPFSDEAVAYSGFGVGSVECSYINALDLEQGGVVAKGLYEWTNGYLSALTLADAIRPPPLSSRFSWSSGGSL